MKMRVLVCSLVFGGALWACGDDDDEHGHGEIENPTLAACDSSVTYDDDVKPFMDTYCVRCHSAQLPSARRNGAPSHANFDTLDGVNEHLELIDGEAGAGPGATNESMPPSGAKPTLAERQMLSNWIACQLNSGN